ncbi:hypothetical protein MMC28_002448 [Mycoblastus sanguinarius]|nr:hypothetical protein [Mycoblastus sanguinarius]
MPCFEGDNASSQEGSPLFNRIPGEIRNRIFELAVTISIDKQESFPRHGFYYRPGFRYPNRKLDTALLSTCRRVYQETHFLPAQSYVRVKWHGRGPPARVQENIQQDSPVRRRTLRTRPRHSTVQQDTSYHPNLRSLHLFTQQCWLEGWRSSAEKISQQALGLHNLKITLRHSDWWWWERSEPLKLDAKQCDTASPIVHSTASDEFYDNSWGHHFYFFNGLKKFELELETVELKRSGLDEIVFRAKDWQFPLGDGKLLVLNPTKTKRRGWTGVKLPSGRHVPNDPVKAKVRLERDGVDFRVEDGEPEILGDDCSTYYVVTLTYEANRDSCST